MSTIILSKIHEEVVALNGEVRMLNNRINSLEDKMNEVSQEWTRYKGWLGGLLFTIPPLGLFGGWLRTESRSIREHASCLPVGVQAESSVWSKVNPLLPSQPLLQ